MKGKIFTPDEANRMLPLVSRIADDIVASYADVNRALQAFEAEKARAEADETREPILRQRDADVAAALDLFGASVSVSGDTVVVGANQDDDAEPNSSAASWRRRRAPA